MLQENECTANLPYEEMYKALQHGQGKQITLCEKALGEADKLYGVILNTEQKTGSQYTTEREGINALMDTLGKLLSCMKETDKAVEDAAIQ